MLCRGGKPGGDDAADGWAVRKATARAREAAARLAAGGAFGGGDSVPGIAAGAR